MKRAMTAVLFVTLCFALTTSAGAREKAPDMSNMHHIFLGWVDLGSGSYKDLGYTSREEWEDVIKTENLGFQEYFQTKLSTDHTIAVAKNKDDVNTAGNDLYVKFNSVSVDHGYRLHISVSLIDLKTNTEIASIPNLTLNGHFCTLKGCLAKDLDEVNERLFLLIDGPQKK